MKIIFFGNGRIAIPSLEFLVKNKENIVYVITSPDKRKGRHLLTSFTPIKEFALKQNLSIFQPINILSKECFEYIKRLLPDIFIVFSFGRIIPIDLLNVPNFFALNIHASLLPKYRGAAPINWALINGEEKTGITIIRMNERMDEGDIIEKKEINIDYNDNALTLENKLAALAVVTLKEAICNIKNNKVCFSKQDENEASFASKLKKDDGRINWDKAAFQIRNQVRGCFSWPGAFTFYKGNSIKILEVDMTDRQIEGKYLPGTIITFDKNGILVATSDKALLIKILQPSSGKRLDAWQFIQGHKIERNEKFG